MSDRHSLPVAVDRAYALWVWLDGRLVDFPAAARPLAGRRAFDAATDVLDALLEATYTPRGDARQRDALVRANQRLALLRCFASAVLFNLRSRQPTRSRSRRTNTVQDRR